ncbi:unnamed protein product [Rangifer tarandus platyrhynchus]|uniref:Uncharacterized protein n=1 Tax=Rangifer tarandus platyrhynchus TaxID=3082113 RepID=A0AC59YQY4_RANTA
MASLRQGGVLVSHPYINFTGRVKWNISCHISKQRCPSYLQFRPPKCEFLSHARKQQTRDAISHMKNSSVTVLHRWAESGYLPVSQTKAQVSGCGVGDRQGSLRQAIMFAYSNKSGKMIKSQE